MQKIINIASNGVIVSGTTSTKDIVHQIAWKYVMRYTVDISNGNYEKNTEISLGRKAVVKISSNEKDIFMQKNIVIDGNSLNIFKSVVVRGIKFSSTLMREVSTIDYFIRLKCNRIASVKFFMVFESKLFAIINLYQILDTYDHFLRIESTENQEVVKISEIREKCLYMKFGSREFVTFPPNKFEKT